jgi:hypothetical protein
MQNTVRKIVVNDQKDTFDAIIELVKEYTYTNRGDKIHVGVTELTPGVVIIDAGGYGEKLLTLTYAVHEIFAQYTELGADTHIPHIPKQDNCYLEIHELNYKHHIVLGVDIILTNDPQEIYDNEIVPRLDYLVHWDKCSKEWVANSD